MRIRKKALYHQIHPVKLVTDVSAGVAACHLLWRRRWLALAIAFLPSFLATVVVLHLMLVGA